MIENGHVGDLAGPYAVGACSPAEAATVAGHVTTCPSCAAEIDTLSRTAEWIGASAARRPPPPLRARVLSAALAARPARPALDAEAMRLTEVYTAQVRELDRLLGALTPEQWSQPSAPHTSVRGLVAHLSGNDRVVADAADVHAASSGSDPALLDRESAGPAGEGVRADGAGVRGMWRRQAGALISSLSHAGGDVLGREVQLAGRSGVRRPLREAMIQRGFETWIHAEDVRAVLDLPPREPGPRQVADIVGFALGLLPEAMRAAGHRGTVELNLTGDDSRVGLVGDGEAVARVTLPAERFCRLLAGRLTPDAAGAEIDGDARAANALLTVASTMGCE
ncbi:hypothetical protein ACTI_52780 [Actinoplanes sp. OR16]|uniref:maleylpyruvate isomerase family mycothiol-dependent enzyme n=1 Tax=Actinoplanes sp. OR16 TaxID=946334 RepID=UPI000F718C48|nr:maleylpyruvate isomerase family mycothiol-dependent enzyme [Actinoplanes sp. OR16]BBH68593.1 hypothetical protein ACTI_52780 [Actinoplanes sp. OR16]